MDLSPGKTNCTDCRARGARRSNNLRELGKPRKTNLSLSLAIFFLAARFSAGPRARAKNLLRRWLNGIRVRMRARAQLKESPRQGYLFNARRVCVRAKYSRASSGALGKCLCRAGEDDIKVFFVCLRK